MHTRLATIDDKATLVALGERAYTEARYDRYPFNRAKLEQLFDRTQTLAPAMFSIVLVDNDRLVGMVVGLVTEHFFADMIYATFLALYVEPDKRGGFGAFKLLRHFEEECIARGADEILVGNSSNVAPARTVDLFHRLGYSIVGANAVKYIGD